MPSQDLSTNKVPLLWGLPGAPVCLGPFDGCWSAEPCALSPSIAAHAHLVAFAPECVIVTA